MSSICILCACRPEIGLQYRGCKSKRNQACRGSGVIEVISLNVTHPFVGTLTRPKAALIPAAITDMNALCQDVARTTHVCQQKKIGIKVKLSPGLQLHVWEQELADDPDKEFLLQGIANGFDIIDDNVVISPVSAKNLPSARPSSELYEKSSKQILSEIEVGNYVVCESPPEIISPIAVIQKPDGDVRLIHDCSRPIGNAINDYYTTDWKQKFSTVDDAAAPMTEGCYFAKVYLKSAYRSVGLSQHSQQVTGLKWQFNGRTVYMRDTKLCFGACLSPGVFHRLIQAVKRMMARRGYDLVIVYLDDFLIISQSQIECQIALNILIQLLRKLGFSIHWGKVVDPTNKITFLGIELDSVAMILHLPN